MSTTFVIISVTLFNISLMVMSSFLIDDIALPIGLGQMPIGRNQNTSILYLFGGQANHPNTTVYTNTIHKRDISNSTMIWQWINTTTPTDIFTSETQSSVTINDLVYFVGVYNGSQNVNDIYIFNITSEEFILNHNYESYKYAGLAGCITTNESHIFMVGGYNSSLSYLHYIQILDVESKTWNEQYVAIGFAAQGCAMVNNVIYIFGGTNRKPIKKIYKYNVLSKEWRIVTNLTNPMWTGYTIYDASYNKIYYLGSGTHTVVLFDVEHETVTYEQILPIAVNQAPITIVNDTLMIFGGMTGLALHNGPFTPMVQMAKLPLVTFNSCSNGVLELNTAWIIIITLIFAISICIFSGFAVYCYKRKFVNSGILLNDGHRIM
eukprot:99581_1